MINNYVQHQYQPCNLIYTFQQTHNNNSLYLGDVSAALDFEFLQTNNIKTVVTAAAQLDQVSYSSDLNINHVIYAVLDHKSENLIKFFDEFYELVEREIKRGSILVHCAAGISRSSTLIIAFLMKKHIWTFKEAISFVRKNRPNVLPNLGFERQLKQFEKILMLQQQRRLKSKTSESNKHIDKNKQFSQIGALGHTSTDKKIIEAIKMNRRQQLKEDVKDSKMENIRKSLKMETKYNFLRQNYYLQGKSFQYQNSKELSRQIGQTKSESLQYNIDCQRNPRFNYRNMEIRPRHMPYIETRRQKTGTSSSTRRIGNGGSLFESAIIPIKYSSSPNKKLQPLQSTKFEFNHLNALNQIIPINHINLLKKKQINNNFNVNSDQNNKNLVTSKIQPLINKLRIKKILK